MAIFTLAERLPTSATLPQMKVLVFPVLISLSGKQKSQKRQKNNKRNFKNFTINQIFQNTRFDHCDAQPLALP